MSCLAGLNDARPSARLGSARRLQVGRKNPFRGSLTRDRAAVAGSEGIARRAQADNGMKTAYCKMACYRVVTQLQFGIKR